MIWRILALAAALALPAGATPAVAAGPDCGGDVPCRIDGGAYRIHLPAETPRGVYVFFHGYRGSAEAQMRSTALIKAAAANGYAFVAPDGAGGSWSHDNSPSRARDDTAFAAALLDDLDRRFGFGPDRVVVGGFSQGASMAFHVVCHMADRVAGAVTFAGVFWNPLPGPGDCTGTPPPILHVHGRTDTVFPLEGRSIGERWHQGDTRLSLALLAERAACAPEIPAPATSALVDGLACTIRPGCTRGAIALCLHEGGHSVLAEWLQDGLAALAGPLASGMSKASLTAD